jgi:glycosyltransferase involved in cell wall biosynthesis/SAM-dependent methyltransferase
LNICTIIAKNYVAHARVLARSFRLAHPEGSCAVLVVDGHEGFLDPAAEPFELIEMDEIGLPDRDRMAAEYDVTELSTAVKPWLLRYLLGREGIDSIAYLDPDILIVDSIAEIGELAARHGIVLTPHFTAPLPRDGRRPSEEDILIAGTYNLGFIALGRGEAADRLLEWWSQRLERHCVIDPANGLFVDQRWIDLVPGIWPQTRLLRDPGYNVAYWNLPTRELETAGAAYLVDGEPLRFFHFSGFDPTTPRRFSKHQDRIEVGSSSALARICGAYAELLLDNGFEEARTWTYGWESLPNGVRLDRVVRSLYREARERDELSGSVFERRGAKRLLAYLNEVPAGRAVSRYTRAFRDSRTDLQEAFPDLDGADASSFERWLRESAEDLGISPQLLPAAPRGGAGADDEPASPAGGRERLGVNLAGYLSSEMGVGEAARQVRAALAARQLPTAAIDVPVEESELGPVLGKLRSEHHPYDVNVVCVNADMLPLVAAATPEGLLEERHTAGLWFWEVERFPERWQGSFDHLDEVWTASEFVAESLRPLAPVPVNTIRVPVTPAEPGEVSREALSMPEGFCFLFVFDYRSVFRRKNPLAVIEAFRGAFEPGSGASLMIKSVGADTVPERAAELAAAAGDHPDIHLYDGVVSAEAKNAMIAGCDCFVSLHRSEGLGLTMAEAMYFGKPVIATGYSGNLDFMTAENSYLVEHTLREIGEGAAPYPADARWAEPAVEHATELMRAVFDDREEAALRGARAAADIRASHSPQAAGTLLEERLAEIRRARVMARLNVPEGAAVSGPRGELVPAPPPAAAIETASARGHLNYLLRFEQSPPPDDAGRLRRFLKRLYMRLLRPYAAHERRIDLSLRDAVLELGAGQAELERRLSRAGEETATELRQSLADVDRRLAGLDGDVRGACAEQARELGETAAALERLSSVEPRVERLGEALERERERAEETAAMTKRLERASERLGEAEEALARDRAFVDALRSRLDRLVAETEGTFATVRGQADEVERLASASAAKPYMADDRIGTRTLPELGTVLGFESSHANGTAAGYRGFEDLFRGPEEMIRERQAVFLPLLGDSAPVLDAGCGRGELLDLLREAGIEARGVDRDGDMVARCREKGHQVEQADLLDALEACEPHSLGAILSLQVIEHLSAEQLSRLLELGATRLRPGGRLLVETVNPHCAAALKAFWVDPTHQRPLFPETVLALCDLAGFASADAFCPLGSGDWEIDRLALGEYAVLATAR